MSTGRGLGVAWVDFSFGRLREKEAKKMRKKKKVEMSSSSEDDRYSKINYFYDYFYDSSLILSIFFVSAVVLVLSRRVKTLTMKGRKGKEREGKRKGKKYSNNTFYYEI